MERIGMMGTSLTKTSAAPLAPIPVSSRRRASASASAAFAVFALTLSTASAGAANVIVQSAIDGFVRPGYAAFAGATKALKADTDALCLTPSLSQLSQARAAFQSAVAAWSRVEIIRFGPVTEENRLEKILYWPDRKGIGLKQVQAAIAKEDSGAANPIALAGKSVAMQGLGALEFVLYGTGAETLTTGAPYRCTFGAAISANLNEMAQDISASWSAADGFAAQWANPAANNALYRTNSEAVSELVDVFVQGLEMVRDVRINSFLGITPEADKPRQALYWRSRATTVSLSANLQGLQALFEASGLAKALTGDSAHIGQSVAAILTNGAAALDGMGTRPIADDLADAESRKKLDYFRTTTSALSEQIGVRLTGALGLSAGFSSLDGD